MIIVAVPVSFIEAGWLGLQLLAILFRSTLCMGARAIAEGKAEAVVGEDSVVVEEVKAEPIAEGE